MNITSTFNAAASGPTGEAGAVASGPSPASPPTPSCATTAVNRAADAPKSPPVATSQAQAVTAFTVESAENELDTLETGRAKPSARHNLNPPTNLKKMVDSKIERQREARISALKAFLEFKQRESILDRNPEFRDAPDLTF